jgi:regulator of replication initiation timing
MSSIVSVDDILGCPTTPQSLDDFSVSSPSSFIGSRHGSPCSYMSSETSPSSVASPPPEEVKIKSEPEAKVKTEPEQKPVKKRKSWGQQLPTPTTNLPPRKRAKTAEEKEQRRVERVLRNRAAAQKSREVKKQQLEAIESERDMLKQKFETLVEENTKLTASNNHLHTELKKIQEENARLKLHSNQPPPPVAEEPSSFDTLFMDCYGVDPNTTVTYPDSAHDDDSVLSESPCMTHQPAVSAGDFSDDFFAAHDIGYGSGMLHPELDLSDRDSALAASPESILDEFFDCDLVCASAPDESDLQ